MLVVVPVIDKDGVWAFKAEGQSKVAIYRDRPRSCLFALERMECITGEVHVFRANRVVEHCKLAAQPFSVLGLDSSFAAGGEEFLQTLVLKAPDYLS